MDEKQRRALFELELYALIVPLLEKHELKLEQIKAAFEKALDTLSWHRNAA